MQTSCLTSRDVLPFYRNSFRKNRLKTIDDFFMLGGQGEGIALEHLEYFHSIIPTPYTQLNASLASVSVPKHIISFTVSVRYNSYSRLYTRFF